MNRWTESAEAQLNEYSAKVRKELQQSGADPEEVAEDLRRHVQEEAEAEKLPLVTAQDVSRILARIGPAAVPFETQPDRSKVTTAPTPPVNGATVHRKSSGIAVLIFGVCLPLGVIIFEYLTGVCAGVFFDPYPTFAHLLLTLVVPVANLAIWLALKKGDVRWRRRLGWANGAALGISAFYALLLLPITPFALLGIVVYGAGLVPLSPLLSFVSACILRTRFSQALTLQSAGGGSLPGLWRGATLSVALLVLLSLPMVLTRFAMDLAANGSGEESNRAVQMLRTVGVEEEMLRACYGRQGGESPIYRVGRRINSEQARGVYYRVTGKPFNSVPPPRLYAGRARWSALEEDFTWDNDQGGDAVAGRIKGLSMNSSRMDGFVDPDAAVAYMEWTFEFSNVSARQREARAQVLLPPGAVVSRLTLWINGEEREAAFGGRSQVKTAYKNVVTARRDPVLVTTCGPDRVMMQCFPVPADGGKMKVRMGITAPLTLTAPDTAVLRAPAFIERNFSINEDVKHSVWLDARGAFVIGSGPLKAGFGSASPGTLHGEMSDAELASSAAVWTIKRSPQAMESLHPDWRGKGTAIRQLVSSRVSPKPSRFIFVIDGTEGVDEAGPALASALSGFAGSEVAVLLALDGVETVLKPGIHSAKALKSAAARLRTIRGTGGHDNIPALLKAWELAAEAADGVIIWLHGPQPVLLDNDEALRQRFERRSAPATLISLQTAAGPNRILEKLDGLAAVRGELRLGKFDEDLTRVLNHLNGKAAILQIAREQQSLPPGRNVATNDVVSTHVARLWAAEEIARLAARRTSDEAMKLAAKYQLVTPVSGAVVLETQQQYAQAGLEPVAPDTVPVVPEPSSAALLLVAAAAWIFRRRLREFSFRRSGAYRS